MILKYYKLNIHLINIKEIKLAFKSSNILYAIFLLFVIVGYILKEISNRLYLRKY